MNLNELRKLMNLHYILNDLTISSKPYYVLKCPKCGRGECLVYYEYIILEFSCGHRYRVRLDKLLQIAEPVE